MDKMFFLEGKREKGSYVKCWEVFNCNEVGCPAYKNVDLKCWLFTGTHCRNEIQGKFFEKVEMCLDCEVYAKNMDLDAMFKTYLVFSKQIKEYKRIVEERDRELENMSLELALATSEVFEALKKISSGDPTVRISEESDIELITKLKQMINKTAENIGEIVDQFHEVAICIAEHFDVLHKVSMGDLSARVIGNSSIELLESLKNVTNDTIENISREIYERKSAEEALRRIEALKSSILSAIPHAVLGLHNRRIFFANEAVEYVFGWKPEELMGKSTRILYRSDKEYEDIGKRFYSILERQNKYTEEYYYRRKDGKDIVCLVSASVIGNKLSENKIVVVYEDITARKYAEAELEKSREQLRYLSAHLQKAIEKERMYIARDIHDELGQLLTAFKMDLHWLSRRIHEDRSDILEKIKSMLELVDIAIKTIHQISSELRPGILDDLGLTSAIEWQVSEFSKRTGIECELNINFSDDDGITQDVSTAIYRILQEALTNIIRHAYASKTWVNLMKYGDEIMLEVRDNGKGIAEEEISNARSYGLTGIRERIHLLGGEVKIFGSPNEGTTIMVSIPLQ